MSEAVTGTSVDPPALDAHARLLEVSLGSALDILGELEGVSAVLADDAQRSGLGSFSGAVAVYQRYAAARSQLLQTAAAVVQSLRGAPEVLEQIAENYRQTEWANESLMRRQGGGS